MKAMKNLFILAMCALHTLPATVMGVTHVVVPCYNEELRLPQQKFLEFASHSSNDQIRFTFVNDGSKDGTLKILRGLAEQRPSHIAVYDMPKNGGKAEAVRSGMLHVLSMYNLTRSDFVAFWDADLATPLETLHPFISRLQDTTSLEMVFGARIALLGRDIEREPGRHYLGRVFATLASMVLDLRIYDTQCGAKMFRATDDLWHALSVPFTSGWIFDVELIARFKRLHSGTSKTSCEDIIYEYPLESWHDIAGSKLDFMSKVNALYGLAKIWYDYFSPFAWWAPAEVNLANAPKLEL
jgi:dolichyl-phosphate beta-glucosyltransferase